MHEGLIQPAARTCRAALLALLAAGGAPSPARAIVFEEFEVFAPPSAEPGSFEVDQHVNYGLRGPSRPEEDSRALPSDRGIYLNTEIGYAVTPWYAVALELPSAVTRDGRLHNGGFKLRNLVRLHAGESWSWGLLLEVQRQPRGFLPHPWGVAVSPLVAWRGGPWQAVLNLALGTSFGSRGAESFVEPAARVTRLVTENVALGLEYYGELGRVERTERFRRQGHQIFAVAEMDLGPAFLRLGLGRGFTEASDRWVATMVLGFDF